MKKEKITIIGAGIIGICSALYLQRQGYQVQIIDKDGVGQGCSKGNAGHFATEQVFPLANWSLLWQLPKILFDSKGPLHIRFSYFFKALPWFMRFIWQMRKEQVSHGTKALRALNERAISAYFPILEAAGAKHLLTTEGSLLTFEQTPDKGIAKVFDEYFSQGVNVEWLNQEQVQTLEPNLSKNVKAALFFKDVGHTFDPEILTKTLAEYFISQGGSIEQVEINHILPMQQLLLTSHDQHSIRYNKLLIACGAWSKNLVKTLDYKLPLDTERGYHLMTPLNKLLNRPVASAERKFIMTPMLKGLRLAGTVEFGGLHAKANPKRAYNLFDHGKALVPALSSPENFEQNWWMGFRPSLPDSLPVIGKAPNHDNIYFAFGHQHLGLTQAAITGKLISQCINNQPTDIDLKPYSITRFQ